ncbi:MAG TPA: YceI family protein [Candidatus Acidoferrales bacterium]|nr:YceI family protein [Candidatus Acidoferrales bacterium]
MRLILFCVLTSTLFPSSTRAQAAAGVPVFEIIPEESAIHFSVKASAPVDGAFGKWDATLTLMSSDATSGVLDIEIQAASVNTGSGVKNRKLKGKDFFNAKRNPLITFRSKKVIQTGPDSFEVDGDFTLRGVTKVQTLTLTITGKGTGSGRIIGTMAFNRKDYGMTKGIPFVKIADRVEVSVNLKAIQVSGPRLVYKQ